MRDTIVALENEIVCMHRQINGCERDCLKCDAVFEDAEIIEALEEAVWTLKEKLAK